MTNRHWLLLLAAAPVILDGQRLFAEQPPKALAPFFKPPDKFAGKFGDYRSPLRFDDGRPVKSADDWQKRRREILKTWHDLMGPWPPLLDRPKVEYLDREQRDGLTQHHVRLEIAPGLTTDDAYLLVPGGEGPFPAVLVVFYDAATGIGRGGRSPRCDFALRLAKRGFVTLSLGSAPATFYPSKEKARLQPLSFHAYVAANCHTILAGLPQVDAKRIGVVGHSYGGKWAMFAGCLYDKFACAAWSDPGIVFDEKRANVNYWEPWYLGYEPGRERKPGLPTEANPRTGAYKRLVEGGHDLHELHALMAPRPFLVSGGSEDGPGRWPALNHAVAVNDLLGAKNRVALTNRQGHTPTDESNEQLCQFFEYALKSAQPAARADDRPVVGLIPRATKPITLDGKLDEWDGAFVTPVHVGHPDFANRGAQFLFLWDDDALYVGLRALDRTPGHVRPDAVLWDGDAVEFYLDARPGADLGGKDFGPGTLHMFWTPFTGTEVKPRLRVRDLPAFKDFVLKGAAVAGARTAWGYTAEFKLPWANFPKFAAKAGALLGLDCELCSGDGGPRVDRTFVYSSPAAVSSPSAFGRVRLVEKPEPDDLKACARALLPLAVTRSANYDWLYATACLSPTIEKRIAKIEGKILDADGKVKKTTAGTRTTLGGSGFVMWHGSWELFDLPAGTYALEVSALDRDGKPVVTRSSRVVH